MKPQNNKTPATGKSRSLSPWRLLPLAVIAAAIVAVFAFDIDHYLSFEALAENRRDLLAWRDSNLFLAALTFIGVYALSVALSLPGAVWLSIGGGFLFGTLGATLWAVIGATIGACAIFLIARYALADFFRAKTGGALRKMEQGFNDNALSYLLVLRLVPLFPFWLVNLVPAFLGVRLSTFVFGTFFGIIPGAFVYTSVGSGAGALIDAGETPDLGIIFRPEILMPVIGLAALALIPVFYKKFKQRKS